jgi:hypothetical protein
MVTQNAIDANQTLDTAANVNFQTLVLTTSILTPMIITSTDSGAGLGPVEVLYRNSASPAAADGLGQITFTGNNASIAEKTFVAINTFITSPVAGSETGEFHLQTINAGAGLVDQFVALSTGCQVRGNNTNTAPPAGYMGQLLTSAVTTNTAISVNAITNLTSLLLTPGNWELTAVLVYTYGTAVSPLSVQGCIATANNNFTPVDNFGSNVSCGLGLIPTALASGSPTVLLGPCRVSIAANTTYFLNGFFAATSAASSTFNGVLRAVRIG